MTNSLNNKKIFFTFTPKRINRQTFQFEEKLVCKKFKFDSIYFQIYKDQI